MWVLLKTEEGGTNGGWETVSATRPLLPLVCNWQSVGGALPTPFFRQPCSPPLSEASVLPDTWHFLPGAVKGGNATQDWLLWAAVYPLPGQGTHLFSWPPGRQFILVPLYSWGN